MENIYNNIFLARISEIKKCLDHKCYIAALGMALTLPDICGKAAYKSYSNKKRFILWYDSYVSPKFKELLPQALPYCDFYPYLNGNIVYSLRCSILHEGNTTVSDNNFVEFKIYIGTNPQKDISQVKIEHNNPVNKSYIVNISDFCITLCDVAQSYYENNTSKFDFFKYNIIV